MGWYRFKLGAARAAGIVAAPSYASFLLTRLVRSPLSQSRAFISEFEIAGQPHAMLFRYSDMAGGVMILLLGLSLPRTFSSDRARRWATAGFGAAGVASVLDGADPMRCAPSLDQGCRSSDLTVHGLLSQWDQLHSVTAVLGVMGFLIAMLATAIALRHSAHMSSAISVASACAVVVLNVGELIVMLRNGEVGVPERVSVSVMSLWLLYMSLTWGRRESSSAPRRVVTLR